MKRKLPFVLLMSTGLLKSLPLSAREFSGTHPPSPLPFLLTIGFGGLAIIFGCLLVAKGKKWHRIATAITSTVLLLLCVSGQLNDDEKTSGATIACGILSVVLILAASLLKKADYDR